MSGFAFHSVRDQQCVPGETFERRAHHVPLGRLRGRYFLSAAARYRHAAQTPGRPARGSALRRLGSWLAVDAVPPRRTSGLDRLSLVLRGLLSGWRRLRIALRSVHL